MAGVLFGTPAWKMEPGMPTREGYLRPVPDFMLIIDRAVSDSVKPPRSFS
jgi:hypothetical protein